MVNMFYTTFGWDYNNEVGRIHQIDEADFLSRVTDKKADSIRKYIEQNSLIVTEYIDIVLLVVQSYDFFNGSTRDWFFADRRDFGTYDDHNDYIGGDWWKSESVVILLRYKKNNKRLLNTDDVLIPSFVDQVYDAKHQIIQMSKNIVVDGTFSFAQQGILGIDKAKYDESIQGVFNDITGSEYIEQIDFQNVTARGNIGSLSCYYTITGVQHEDAVDRDKIRVKLPEKYLSETKCAEFGGDIVSLEPSNCGTQLSNLDFQAVMSINEAFSRQAVYSDNLGKDSVTGYDVLVDIDMNKLNLKNLRQASRVFYDAEFDYDDTFYRFYRVTWDTTKQPMLESVDNCFRRFNGLRELSINLGDVENREDRDIEFSCKDIVSLCGQLVKIKIACKISDMYELFKMLRIRYVPDEDISDADAADETAVYNLDEQDEYFWCDFGPGQELKELDFQEVELKEQQDWYDDSELQSMHDFKKAEVIISRNCNWDESVLDNMVSDGVIKSWRYKQ